MPAVNGCADPQVELKYIGSISVRFDTRQRKSGSIIGALYGGSFY